MRTSHREIRKRIVNEKDQIADESLFGSSAFAAYLADIAESAAKRYKRRIRVKANFDPAPGADTAWTDKRTIYINTGNYSSMSFPTKQLKADSLVGLIAHEVAHLLYSDFKIFDTHVETILQGGYYPRKPDGLSVQQEDALYELDQYLQEKDDNALKMLAKLTHDLVNITEDAYVNARICQDYPGKFKTGVRLNQIRKIELSQSILVQIDSGLDGYSIVRNLILQYATCGDINNLGEYTGEYLNVFHDCMPLIDDCKYDDDSKSRGHAANLMILTLWKYVKPLLEKAKAEGFDDASEEVMAEFEKGTQVPEGRTKPMCSRKFSPPDPTAEQEELSEIQQVVDYATERMELIKTEEIEDGDNGTVDRNDCYTGTGYENCGSDIERLLFGIAEDRVNQRIEQELSEELQDEAGKIRYGNAHTGIHVTVNRMVDLPEYLVSEYKRISQPLLLLSKRMQKQVLAVLKDQRQGGKLSGLLMGRRFEARSAVRDDGRHFSNTRLPVENCDLAVALLVDESGSMSGLDRITTARAASIVIYDFCRALGIPVMVMGHTASSKDVELFSYADFDSVDKKDCFRMMDMTSRWSNRDGAALRYVAERLMKRPESSRILILISDGQPADTGYYGTEAEADLRGIRLEYSRKGITLFAAAIGDDKESIERIYQHGFLDITDVSSLPMNLTKLIQQHIKTA